MAARTSLFLLISLIGTLGSPEWQVELIVWNVGQGQWVTVSDERGCWHLDMGGEFAPWQKIMALCRERKNFISLSHWDYDHISFAGKVGGKLPDVCLVNKPLGPGSPRKERLLSGLRGCPFASPFVQWSDPGGKTANAKSWVVLWYEILAQGDSPRSEEKFWVWQMSGLASVHYLILGHHGSRTSTSELLLQALPNVRLAFSSARLRRYGHPHAEVVRELAVRHIPLLRTEEWGSIHLRE